MGDPELIMIDEPTEGLAPLIVQQVGDLIARIAEAGVAILLVGQKLSTAWHATAVDGFVILCRDTARDDFTIAELQ
jgi:ABC-type branched-subunit amino acid transport system ATPase component